MKIKLIILFLFISGLFSKCVEPFEHEIQSYQDILVVEGYITNEPGPYTIDLSRTVPVNSDKVKKEQDAFVKITDNYGNTEILAETSPGVYKTAKNGIQGIVGRDYTLHINTADGKKYESAPVTLNPVPGIDSLYLTYKETFSFEEDVIYLEVPTLNKDIPNIILRHFKIKPLLRILRFYTSGFI